MPGGANALIVASASGHEALGKFLLDQGAQPNVKDKIRDDAPAYGGAIRKARIGSGIARRGRPKRAPGENARSRGGGRFRQNNVAATTSLLAARAGHADVMRALIEAHTDTSLKTQDGTTALIAAASSADLDAVKVAYELGGDVNARTDKGQTAVHAVVSHFGPKTTGIDEVIQFLADKGADLNVKDARGITPLAICDRRTIDVTGDLINRLIARKAEPAQ